MLFFLNEKMWLKFPHSVTAICSQECLFNSSLIIRRQYYLYHDYQLQPVKKKIQENERK